MESNQAAQPVVDDEQLEELFIGHVQTDDHEQEWKVPIQVTNNLIYFQVDTGSQANIISSDVFNSVKGTPHLKTTKAQLTGVSGSEIPVNGSGKDDL